MNSHEVKVSNSNPPSKGKGHRDQMTGSCKSNAQYPGFPKMEAPWPEKKSQKV